MATIRKWQVLLGAANGMYYGNLNDLATNLPAYAWTLRSYNLGCDNAPAKGYNDGYCLSAKITDAGSCMQLATTDENIYYRFKHYQSSWGDWKKVTLSAV